MSRSVVAFMLFAAVLVVFGQTANGAPECPVNSVWELCGTLCEPTCADQKPNPMTCPSIECTQITAGCRCLKGYVRNENTGNCVLPKNC